VHKHQLKKIGKEHRYRDSSFDTTEPAVYVDYE
jgi:hypothetical protein